MSVTLENMNATSNRELRIKFAAVWTSPSSIFHELSQQVLSNQSINQSNVEI